MMRVLAAAVLLLGGCATTRAPAPSADAVIAAERAFAADAQVMSTRAAFLKHAADHGVMVRGGEAVNAKTFIASWPQENDAGYIKWWPAMAGVARSGDFGFTTGPAIFGKDEGFSHYFTIWERQADGQWRWLFDMGPRTAVKPSHQPDDPVTVVPVSGARPSSAEAATAEVRALDAELTRAMATNYAAAHRARLAPDARIFGLEPAPAVGAAAIEAALAARPKTIASEPLGGGAARTGDLAYTYGRAEWTGADGKTARGPYLRVWQRQPPGWVIVADAIG
ncbi:MAG TPA: nuclear transport factor 2 family protein [Caulobacteraceae bacterium]|jgi:ketosteroid isomerase-like protein